jgi:ureidoglycolate lyase
MALRERDFSGGDRAPRLLPVEPATRENIAPYGELISTADMGGALDLRFYDDSVEVCRLPGFVSDEQTELTLARISPRPPTLLYLERHFKHTQVFLPLGGQDYFVALAPPDEREFPEPEALAAFRIPGDTGLMLHLGTWHEFPFVVDSAASMLVILRRETVVDLQVDSDNSNEAVGPDLEKRDLQARWPASYALNI